MTETTTDVGLVFISGGSALNKLARLLANNRLFATYIISVFDNGGSTALLRDYCNIAIGDIRNRLIAIAEHDSKNSKSVVDLFSLRIHGNKPRELFRGMVEDIAEGRSDFLEGISPDSQEEIATALAKLLLELPGSFDWREGAIGNFILVGKYLQCRSWKETLEWAHQVLSACGLVLPTTIESAHLGARLRNGKYVVGQNRLTDENRPIQAPIEKILLLPSDTAIAKTKRVSVYPPSQSQLERAKTIVYSWGSFYTSVLSNFLVDGLPEAILKSNSPKVLLLNPFKDAETLGKTPINLLEELLQYGERSSTDTFTKVLTHLIVLKSASPSPSHFYSPSQRAIIEKMGISVIEVACEGIPKPEELETVMQHLLALSQRNQKDEVK